VTESMIELADVERVAALLDARCADLNEKDRSALHAIFALAGRAVAPESDEVRGFELDSGGIPLSGGLNLGGSLFQSFQWGVGRKGWED